MIHPALGARQPPRGFALGQGLALWPVFCNNTGPIYPPTAGQPPPDAHYNLFWPRRNTASIRTGSVVQQQMETENDRRDHDLH